MLHVTQAIHHHPCYTKLHKVTVVTHDTSYIVASNDPVYKHHYPCYTSLHKVTVVTRDTSYTVTGAYLCNICDRCLAVQFL